MQIRDACAKMLSQKRMHKAVAVSPDLLLQIYDEQKQRVESLATDTDIANKGYDCTHDLDDMVLQHLEDDQSNGDLSSDEAMQKKQQLVQLVGDALERDDREALKQHTKSSVPKRGIETWKEKPKMKTQNTTYLAAGEGLTKSIQEALESATNASAAPEHSSKVWKKNLMLSFSDKKCAMKSNVC